MWTRWSWWFVLAIACSKKSSPPLPPDPGPWIGKLGDAAQLDDTVKHLVDIGNPAAIVPLGEAWRRDPMRSITLDGAIAIARKSASWAPVVPYVRESLRSDDHALAPALESIAALGAADPKTAIQLLAELFRNEPLKHDQAHYERLGSEVMHIGHQLVPALVAVIAQNDAPESRVAAIGLLGDLGGTEARPLLLAELHTPPVTDLKSPSLLLRLSAMEALTAFGPDAQTANAMFEFAMTPDNPDGERFDAIEFFTETVITPTPEQLRVLREHAERDGDDRASAGTAYAILVSTPAELEPLRAIPIGPEPYGPDFTRAVTAGTSLLGCKQDTVCLVRLIANKAHDEMLVRGVLHHLVNHPDPAAIPLLLDIVDAPHDRYSTADIDQRHIIRALPWIARGPCPLCVERLDAFLAKQAKLSGNERSYQSEEQVIVERLRARR